MTTVYQIAKMIDHSLLHPTMTDADMDNGIAIAKKYNVKSVCVKPYYVQQTVAQLKGTDILTCSVIGFPAGNSSIAIKVAETEQALADGATEIDMVINIGKALGGDWDYVFKEIKAIKDTCTSKKAILKVIFETDYVTNDSDKIRLCSICTEIGVAFVKTSTGFGFVKEGANYSYVGATPHDISLMRKHSGAHVGVKASGGVRSYKDVANYISLGVTRFGATATAAILEEAKVQLEGGASDHLKNLQASAASAGY